MCSFFQECKSSDILIRLPFQSSLWISISSCKFTILPNIQPASRIVIISASVIYVQLLEGQEGYRLLWAVMINPPELPVNVEARNHAHISSTGVWKTWPMILIASVASGRIMRVKDKRKTETAFTKRLDLNSLESKLLKHIGHHFSVHCGRNSFYLVWCLFCRKRR